MKIYIMYEVAGAMGHVAVKTREDEETRRAVAAEINAAIAGATEAGATAFVVNTGSPWNQIGLEELDARAELIRGWWKPDQTMEGMDETFDAAFVLSMHAKARTPNALAAHTWSFTIYDFRVDGVSIGELGMAVYFAAACGVPTVLVSGDTATCAEARDLLGDVETVPTKEGISWASAKCRHPSLVLKDIREAAKRAIDRLGSFRSREPARPVTVEIDMVSPNMIPWWTAVPTVETSGPCGVTFQAPDYRAAHRLFVMMDKLHAALHDEVGITL